MQKNNLEGEFHAFFNLLKKWGKMWGGHPITKRVGWDAYKIPVKTKKKTSYDK